jgi:uroporphyrinogen decarboxylase
LERMSSPERVCRVLQGERPDRVPVLLQNFQNTAALAGMTLREFCLSAEKMSQAQLEAWRRFRYDILDLENGTVVMAEALGCEVEYPQNEPPMLIGPALNNLDEIDQLKPIDPTRDGRLPEFIKATSLIATGLKGGACIVGEADQGPFSLASMLLGMERFLMSLTQPELESKIFRLLDFCYSQVKKLALAQVDAGADFTQIGDSIAGPDVCSPAIYRRFAWPYENRLARELARLKIPLILHICGNCTSIIEDMASSGAQMLEVDHKIDILRCRELTQDRSVLVGYLDPSSVMTLGSPEDVLSEARHAIKVMGQRGMFILSPGCTLPSSAPPENTEALMEAARQFGRYGKDGLLVNSGSE